MHLRYGGTLSSLFSIACVLGFTPTSSAVPACSVGGDGNGDCRIDLDDLADFTACMTGPAVPALPECACYDMNGDGAVDMGDTVLFQQQFTGASLINGCVLPVREDEPGTLRPNKSGSPTTGQAAIPDSTVNDSVYLFSGEFHLTETDLVIRGRGFDFEWTRRYRSKIGPDTEMGNGWDYCYNIRLEQAGPNLIFHDGDGRRDEYCLNPSNVWVHPEFFRELSQTPGGFQMVFPDRATWEFNGFSGLPDDGKITSMSDRNGNRMLFEYDPGTGRLTTIRDTLDNPVNARAITITYNVDGFIQTITDFIGRQVTYDYYQDPDIGGDNGDLKSVTTPIVVGTPNGNDFPAGKTTVYTYSEGTGDARLDHNLLTITDPKGQTYIQNIYAATLNPADLEYDHIVTQRFGLPNEQYAFFYLPLVPSAANNYSTVTCIVNDRVGNVEEASYDHRNRLAMVRRFTGRANPVAPTTDVLNRPVNQLRTNDPPFFESRFEYNDESLLTRVIAPELEVLEIVYEGDLDFFAPSRKRREKRRMKCTPGPRGGSQPEIVQEFEYDDAINFDTSQVTRWIDGRGNQSLFEYDANGNLTRSTERVPSIVEEFSYNPFGQITLHKHPDNGSGSQREDQFTYYPPAAGGPYGYLESEIIDAPGFVIVKRYDYDFVGNVTRVVDPKGNDTQYTFNQLDQVVRSLSREVVPGAGPRYERFTYYDPNDNVVRLDVENRDASGALQPNTHFTTEYEYDILNYVTRRTEEVDPVGNVVTEYDYDANRNQVQQRLGEATNGIQPNNTVTSIYDERDLLFQSTRAAGDPDASTDRFDYDRNGNLTLDVQGLQGITPRESRYTYDGYNRLTIFGDSFGNDKFFEYDPNHNVVRDEVQGELQDVAGNGSNVRLSETRYVYDAINRLTIHGANFFDSAQAPLTDGESTTVYVYSDSSHLLQVTDDNAHTASCIYDSANRRSVCTDPRGNTVRYTYDNNSNVINEDETDKSDLGLADQLFTDTYGYDGLDRLTLRGDNFGNTKTSQYDSRDLLEEDVDALGNTTTYEYDGLNRMTRTEQILTDTGTGAGVVVGSIVTTQDWDDTSRLILQGDGNGNATSYIHDPLNRPAFVNFADGSSESFLYDPHDNKIVHTDANGTQIDYTYDLLNRLDGKIVTPAPGVSPDTTFEQYGYDGLDRLVSAVDNDSQVSFEYDSLSNRVSESLNGVSTLSTYDGVGNRDQCIYPNGRTIDRTYDTLDRLVDVVEGLNLIANFAYVGSDRVQFRSLGNGSITHYEYDGITGVPNRPGDFGVKQLSSTIHDHPGLATLIDVRDYHWDPQYNKNVRVSPTSQLEHIYEYDSIYRLTRTVVNDITGPVLVRDTQYQLDNVGNRNQVINDNCPGVYGMDPVSPPADFQMNQYTATGCDNRQYDDNGNWIQQSLLAPNALMVYDYKDRLIQHNDVANGVTTVMSYDALGRRISQVTSTAVPLNRFQYFYDGDHVIEEQDIGGAVTSYIYGDHVDEIIQMQRGANDLYYHCDDVGNVLALTDSNGVTVERYDYQDYGEPEFFNGVGVPIGGSAFENPYLFTGRRFDTTTGLYYYRARYLDPIAGRFIQRDPLGIWGDDKNTGNGYSYCGSNPWTYTDPSGKARISRSTLKSFYETGDKPTQAQFGNLIDSYVHRLDDGLSSGLSKADSKRALEGFGSYSISKRAARTGRNPQTGKEIQIAAKNVVKFKAGADLSKKVNVVGGGRKCVCGRTDKHKHRGHVTILKLSGGVSGGGTHCPGCGAMLCRCTTIDDKAMEEFHHEAKVMGRLSAGPGKWKWIKATYDGGIRAAGSCKVCGKVHSIPPGSTGFYCSACQGCCRVGRGHMKVWKVHSGSGGFDWPGENGGIVKVAICSNCGRPWTQCDGHKPRPHEHRGHVTILK